MLANESSGYSAASLLQIAAELKARPAQVHAEDARARHAHDAVLGPEPPRQPFGGLLRNRPVEPRPDDELGDAREWSAINRDALEDLPPCRAALMRLLAEEVLDPKDVGEVEVAVVALQLFRQRLPADRDQQFASAPRGRTSTSRQIAANRLTQPTLHPITIDCATQHASHCESNPGRVSLRTSQVKNCHMSRKMTLALLINPLKIGVAEQARAA